MIKISKFKGFIIMTLAIAIWGLAVSSFTACEVPPPSPIPDDFILINGGTFLMGSPPEEPGRDYFNDGEHQVTVTVSSFYIGKYLLTQEEYEEIMEENNSRFIGENLPVEMVSWFDAVEYCNKRSLKENLTPAYTISGTGDDREVTWNRQANGYRLPTEAEWEYACRAGTTTPFYTGYNITTDQANYRGDRPYIDNEPGIYRQATTSVGSFEPNEWGLYDMPGNVHEWCWDWYERNYSSGAQTDPTGAVSGSDRVVRGGYYGCDASSVRSAYRNNRSPSYRNYYFGFRVVRP